MIPNNIQKEIFMQEFLSDATKIIAPRRREQLLERVPFQDLKVGDAIKTELDGLTSIYGIPVKVSIIVEDV